MRNKISIIPLICLLLVATAMPAQEILDAVKQNNLRYWIDAAFIESLGPGAKGE
jgi:uncharacterized membrane protein YbhN (UPF0104 family)